MLAMLELLLLHTMHSFLMEVILAKKSIYIKLFMMLFLSNNVNVAKSVVVNSPIFEVPYF